jgi:glutamine synthetase
MTEGMGFDGSSIEGFSRIEESDMIAKPDPVHLPGPALAPGRETRGPDVLRHPAARRHPLSWRPALCPEAHAGQGRGERLHQLSGAGAGVLLFRQQPGSESWTRAVISTPRPWTGGNDLRRATIFALESMGVRIEYSHHEVADSQHEIDMRYDEAMRMADKTMTMKATVKAVAMINGVYATFMPKPIFGINGSGMHTHQSLFKGGKNAFYDASDEYHLSAVGKSYIAGLLKHAREITGICSQWVNSYKRLVPGYEAPVYVAWARRNRSALVRVPMYKPGKETATRCEYRAPTRPATLPGLRGDAGRRPQGHREQLSPARTGGSGHLPHVQSRTREAGDRRSCPAVSTRPSRKWKTAPWSKKPWASISSTSSWKTKRSSGMLTGCT